MPTFILPLISNFTGANAVDPRTSVKEHTTKDMSIYRQHLTTSYNETYKAKKDTLSLENCDSLTATNITA